jgi:hypothetical protein
MHMKIKLHWTKCLALAGMTLLAVAGCSGGGPGGQGMTPGPAAGVPVDAFTSTVATMTKDAPDDTVPVDIEAIAVVLVDDQPAVTVN